jgi:predicted nucleic acid-binding protein
MPTVCCDTSFLFSLYGNDVHTPKALRLVKQLGHALTISTLNQYELANALRFAEWRKLLDPGKAAVYLADFDADVAGGSLSLVVCNLADIVTEATRLSAAHTPTGGHRSFVILHVAVALHLNAPTFVTFDGNQQRLAEAEGLKVLT